jgi:hypothetical protein
VAYREERGFKKENEEEDAFVAVGDAVIAAAPESVSARESLEKNRDYWDPSIGGHPGFEGVPVPPPARLPAAEYSAPPSNLKPGPITITELKSRSAGWPSI